MPAIVAAVGSLILGISLIQLANGYIGTLIGIRLAAASVEPVVTGIVTSAYFAGYAAGAVLCHRLIERAGHIDVVGHVVLDESEARLADQVGNVVRRAGQEVVHADDLVPLCQEPIAQVRAQEAGRAGNQDAHVLNHSMKRGIPSSTGVLG